VRRVELLVEVDQRILGDTAIVEVPWDMVKKLSPLLEEAGIIVLSSRDRRYRVAAGNVHRLMEAVRVLHAAMDSYLKRTLLN
jgi:hypothetical protein